MSHKTSGGMSHSFRINKAKKLLKLSETKLIEVLKGNTSLKEKDIVGVALELYKRRVPVAQDASSGRNQLTVVKIVKNHLPDNHDNVIDVENAAEEVITKYAPKQLTRKLSSVDNIIEEEDEEGDYGDS